MNRGFLHFKETGNFQYTLNGVKKINNNQLFFFIPKFIRSILKQNSQKKYSSGRGFEKKNEHVVQD